MSDDRTYLIQRRGRLLTVGFGTPSIDGGEIVHDAAARLTEMDKAGELSGGGLIGLTGSMSVAVAMTVAHVLAHRFSAVAVRDPKMDVMGTGQHTYIVSISHDPKHPVGSLLTEEAFHAEAGSHSAQDRGDTEAF